MLYGLNVPYKTPIYASAAAGFITGLTAGLASGFVVMMLMRIEEK